MKLTVLAATGATGRELTRQALERGHSVTALARRPDRLPGGSDRLTRVAIDARDPGSVTRAVDPGTVVLSGLGIADGEEPGVLVAGARAVLAAGPQRVVWLGAVGTGASAAAAGWATRALLGAFMRKELPDRVAADTAVLAASGTVFHAGPLSNGPLGPTRRTVGLADLPRRFFPARVSRATVAAAMLDEAESPRFAGATAVPLER
jgi:uncharacterized protein YbjT (DUF2867 family)